METLFSSGHIVDLVIAVMILEAVGLLILRRSSGRGLGAMDIAWMILPGFFLLLALRAALLSSPWQFIAGALACAFVAHLGDLWRRTRRA